jgi:predicted  nucleic acid-binding Zn-ribbon protein
MQAANYATASLGHALKLQEELENAKAELAETKKAAAAEVESARAAAVQEFLGSEEHERRLAEEALKGYERGMEDMKRVALSLRFGIDPARLSVPPGGFR